MEFSCLDSTSISSDEDVTSRVEAIPNKVVNNPELRSDRSHNIIDDIQNTIITEVNLELPRHIVEASVSRICESASDIPESIDQEHSVLRSNDPICEVVSELTDFNDRNDILNHFSGKNLIEDLRKYAIITKCPHSKLGLLLSLLRLYGLDVPIDPRTLLKTPRSTEIMKGLYGEYKHFGLLESIQNIVNKNQNLNLPETLNLGVGIDDVPTYKGISITLILGCLDEINEVFIIGIYKPFKLEDKEKDDPDVYLSNFAEDMSMLEIVGVECINKRYNIEFSKLVADAVAKSKVLKQAGHTGYLSCTKCWIYGSYKNRRVCFNDTNCARRLDTEAKALSTSILKTIRSFQFISKVPLDYMHLVCLGVVRTILNMLTSGGKNVGLGADAVRRINRRLRKIKEYTPAEFVRKPDTLSFLSMWKATQLRQFLLYISYAAMVDIIPLNIFTMFLRLSVAIRILCSSESSLYDEAHFQLLKFLEEFAEIFGEEYLSHNFHGLSHLRHDVELHGPLDNFSAFKYENFMQSVLKDIRKPDKIVQQIYRRQKEREQTPLTKAKKPFKPIHNKDGPTVDGFSGDPYSKIKYKKLTINTKSNGDNCFLIGSKIVVVENIIFQENKYFLITRRFKDKSTLFNTVMDSETLKIFKCSNLSTNFKVYEISKITSKLYRVPLKNDAFMVSPLIHFESNDEYQ